MQKSTVKFCQFKKKQYLCSPFRPSGAHSFSHSGERKHIVPLAIEIGSTE